MNELTLDTLGDYDGEYLSIGITEDRTPRRAISIPWDRTVTAMNMKLPQLYLSEKDIQDEQILKKLQKYKVWGVYSFIPLEDYSFLAQFPNLRDVSLKYARNLKSLEFLRGKEWKMLYVEEAHLKDLEPAFEVSGSVNLALLDCEVENIDAVLDERITFLELAVFHVNPEEKKRWKKARAFTYKFYQLKEA